MIEKKVQAMWFTNVDHDVIPNFINLVKEYNPEKYPKYDNYNAIEVSKTKDIPKDFDGVMGVPISFMTKYNPEQFEIVGLNSGIDAYESRPVKKYINAKQVDRNGKISAGSKVNTRSALLHTEIPNSTYYVSDNVNGYLTMTYARIFIKRRNHD